MPAIVTLIFIAHYLAMLRHAQLQPTQQRATAPCAVAIANVTYILLAVTNKMNVTAIMSSLSVAVRYDGAMIVPSQIRAARALLGWKQTELAAAAGVSEISIKNIERGATDARGSTLGKIQAALEAAGIEIIPAGGASIAGDIGVRRRR